MRVLTMVGVTLTAGSPVAGTQNDVAFPPDAPIAAAQNGRPDCTVNPAMDATVFSFQPPG